MEQPIGELEVVRDDDERAERDERDEPPGDLDRSDDADGDGAREPDPGDHLQHCPGDGRLQGPAPELVEGVGRQAHAQEEGERGGAEAAPVEDGGRRRPDRHVRQVPRRVRRMQQRPVVAPSAGGQRVERRPRLAHEAFTPHKTIPPPRLITR